MNDLEADASPCPLGQLRADPMYWWWTLLLAGPLLVGAREDEVLSRFLGRSGTRPGAFNFTGGRDKRSSECDCGSGTTFCFIDKGKKYCECENNILVIDFPCQDCLCVNGICHESSDCRCQTGYGLQRDNHCEPCDCGEGHQCFFHGSYEFCSCWEEFISVNIRCTDCHCGPKEVCYGRQETRTCPCTEEDLFIPECEDCHCSENVPCTYNVTIPTCKCLPNQALLNGTCTECLCDVVNTRCDFLNGTKVCSCKKGFEEHNGTCEECFCGEGHSCTFKDGSAVCICEENHAEHNGTCKECTCGEAEVCEFVDGKPTCACKENFLEVGGLCKECFCGEGQGCGIIEGKKLCICKKNFAEKDGICEECKCGTGHDCVFQDGKKVCLCPAGYAEMTGICVECSCGNDTACLFAGEEKLCFCKHGYTQKDGECVEICQEDTCRRGTCQVDGETFRCNCDVGFGGVQCDEEYVVSKEATVLIATLTSITLFWIILLAAYLWRRRTRYEPYHKETLSDEMLMSTTVNLSPE